MPFRGLEKTSVGHSGNSFPLVADLVAVATSWRIFRSGASSLGLARVGLAPALTAGQMPRRSGGIRDRKIVKRRWLVLLISVECISDAANSADDIRSAL
jgi:hypothetical protein